MSTRRLVHALVAAALTPGASLAVYRVYINIKRGGEAEAFRRAQQILGVRQAWLVPIPGPVSEQPGLIAVEPVTPG